MVILLILFALASAASFYYGFIAPTSTRVNRAIFVMMTGAFAFTLVLFLIQGVGMRETFPPGLLAQSREAGRASMRDLMEHYIRPRFL